MSQAAGSRGTGHILKAMAWMMGALVSFSMVAIAGRAAGTYVSTAEMMLWRSLIGLVIVSGIAQATIGLRNCWSARPGLHLLRSVVHFGAQFSWLYALQIIPLAQLLALEFTSPLWVAVLAPLLIGERLNGTRIAAAVIGFVGMLVVARPGAASFDLGSVLALLSAIGFASVFIATRRLTLTDSALQILLYMSAIQVVMSGVLALATGLGWPPTAAWLGLLGVGVFGLSAHFSLANAFANADAIIVAPMDLMRLPLMAFVGTMLYGEPLDPLVLIGGAIVIVGNLVNLFGERRTGRSAVPRPE